MLPADLIRMSTQIAQFFEAYPEEEAVAGVTDHLLHFWEATMREQLLAMHRSDPSVLHPLVARAAARLAADPSP